MKRLLFLLLLTISRAAAGLVELSAISPRNAAITGTLRIAHVDAAMTMRGVLAETQATLTLTVEADPALRMEGRLGFTLPPGCTLTGAALDIGDTMRPASITFQQTAKQAYDAVVSRMLDPCLIQMLPDGRVTVQVFPFQEGKPRKLRLEFAHVLKPGGVWEFPLSFAEPVPMQCKADAPGAPPESSKTTRGGSDWQVPSAESAAGPLLAHADAFGRWFFQTVLPPAAGFEAPQHLLLVADVSLLQAARDAAAERAWLERLLAKMQTGRVTLAVFSIVLHSTTEFEVRDGKCAELIALMESLPMDGAPRPGAVDLNAVPANLTVLISTLAAPMGGGREPALPSAAPVWVMDSVSVEPSAAARHFAQQRSGVAFHPGRTPECSFQRREAMSGPGLQRLVRHTLPGGAVLLTGELTAERSELVIDGRTHAITRGNDAAAATLIAHQQARENFAALAVLSAESLRSGPNLQPWLIPATAFIVLEQISDYTRFGVPLPPGLQAGTSPEDDRYERQGYAEFRQSLQRAAGTRGVAYTWMNRLKNNTKASILSVRRENLARFYSQRLSVEQRADAYGLEDDLVLLRRWEASALVEMTQMEAAWEKCAHQEAAAWIRRARAKQAEKLELIERIEQPLMPLDGPGFDPIRPAGLLRLASGSQSDPFAGLARAADGFASNDDSPPADPFASADDTGSGQGTGSGAGIAAGGAGFGTAVIPGSAAALATAPPVLPPPAELSAESILQRATALRREGRQADALRALTTLALPARQTPELLHLLAWMLIEWNEPALAREVLEHARHTSDAGDAALRGLALLELAAGNKDAAKTLLATARHDVARRDLDALNGNLSAALRITLECASVSADADLEIEGPDFELCSWRNPLPAFGGALSFDGTGLEAEDFVLPQAPSHPLQLRIHLHSTAPCPVRVTIISNWGRPEEKRRVILIPMAAPGRTAVEHLPAGP